MPDNIRGFFRQLGESWRNLPRQAKVVIPAVSVAILAGLIGIIILSSGSGMVLLYGNLNAENLHDIQIELSRMNVKYSLDQTNSIYVPAKDEARLRLLLSELGLPRSDDGYSIFKEKNLGETFFDYERKYQEATEKKLKRAIESLKPVRFASVNISPMEESVFIDDEHPAKASVMIELNPGSRINRTQVEGIINLVAKAVKGLSPENVSIVDDHGIPLNTDTGEMDTAQWRLKHQSELEKMFSKKIKDLLVPLVGPGGFSSEVTVETDFDTIETTTTKYMNEDQVVKTETTSSENTQGAITNNALPPGTASNVVSSAQLQLNNTTPISTTKTDTVKEYMPSETIQKQKNAPGGIKKVAVSVLLDYKPVVDADGNISRVAWTQQELQMIEDNIKSAVGFDETRGDMVKVNSIQFDTVTTLQKQAELKSLQRRQMYVTAAKYASVLVLGIMLLFLIRSIIRAFTPAQAHGVEQGMIAGADGSMAAIQDEGMRAITGTEDETEEKETAEEDDLLELDEAARLSLEEVFPELNDLEREEAQAIQKKVLSFAEKEPETIARILKTWLAEDKE